MNRRIFIGFFQSVAILAAMVTTLVLITGSPALATSRTFNAGSYILSADSCWQPNGDTSNSIVQPAVCDTNKNDQSVFQLYGLLYALLDTGDQPDLCVNNDGSVPQQKAMLGSCKQLKVYWIVDATKTDPQAADLTLSSSDAAVNTNGIITIYNSGTGATAKTKAGNSTTSVPYKGGPFVIDGNDLTTAEFNAIKAKFPSVKMHKANIPFTGNVDKILIGKPPKIAVLNEGSSEVLEDYIRAAGQFAWRGVVFQYLSAREIISGCLQDPIPSSCSSSRPDISAPFQLIWAPHWEIENKWKNESTSPSSADQTTVVREIRSFLERGNSGFFECASIASLEGSTKKNNIGMSVDAGVGGYLISSAKAAPRTENNAGCFENGNCDQTSYLKFEKVPFWLTQCGGWNYKPTTGLVSSTRPFYDGTSAATKAASYSYLTSQRTDNATTTDDERFVGTQMTRFIHDDPLKLKKTTTSADAYDSGTDNYHVFDYLLGGRINGSPTQGYVIYFPGHKYISCTNNTTYTYPPSRNVELVFDSAVPPTSKIDLELVHGSCTKGSNCPKVEFNMATGSGTKYTADSRVTLSAEFASYDATSNRLQGIVLSSAFDDSVATSLQITDLYATFDGNAGAVKLTNIVDLSEFGKHSSLCAPNATSSFSPLSEVRCSLTRPETTISFNFGGDITAKVHKDVAITVTTASDTVTATCTLTDPVAPATTPFTCSGANRTATSGNLTLDLTSAVFDMDTFTLDNAKIKRGGTCADLALTDIRVTWPGSTVDLLHIFNETGREKICSPDPAKKEATTGSGGGPASVNSCSGQITPVVTAGPKITTELNFNSGYLSSGKNATNVEMELTYSCGPSCTGTVKAKYTTTTSPNTGESVTSADGYVTLDTSSATFTNSNKTLSTIYISSNDASKTITLTKVKVWFQGSKQLKRFKDNTNAGTTIYDFNSTSTSPATSSAITYKIQDSTTVVASTGWKYTLLSGMCSYYISPYLSTCNIDWNSSNTCGIKYVLNTFLALKYQSTSSEFSKTQPLVKDNILYKASFDYPSYRGHLKMIKVPTSTQASSVTVWDAASNMPSAGISSFPASPLASTDTTSPRYIFTNTPGSTTHVNFDAGSAATLQTALAASSTNEAIVLINTVRGRKSASTSDVYGSTSSCTGAPDGTLDLYGCSEDSKRLWAIENSTPALKTKSKYVESTATAAIVSGKDRRDRILFAGGDDGMLHAFWAGTYDAATGTYPDTAAGRGTGKEIWAYIPSSLLSNLKNQPFNPDPSNESSFEPKVTVDGSPALSDFLICTDKNTTLNTCNKWEWKTRLVGTAMVRSENRGIVFSIDVTDPYNPQLLWENTYDKTTDASCSSTASTSLKNCNMGNSMGVAIGTAQIGDQLKDYVFLTSSWISKKKVRKSGATPVVNSTTNEYEYDICSASDTSSDCVYGVSSYALDLDTGKVMWERSLPYSGDAVGVNVTPAVPALMDRDNNGSYDYVVFGDMQGRLWALRTTDGKNLTDAFTASNHVSIPVYQVKNLVYSAGITDVYSTGVDAVPAVASGAAEPIAAPVSVYRDYVVLATGGADYASSGSATDAQKYRIEVLKIGLTGGVKDDNQTVVLSAYDSTNKKGNEKVWAKPSITSDLKVYIGTARSYYSNQTVATQQSDGRILVLDLKVKRDAATSVTNVGVVGGLANQWQSGGFVGGFDFDKKHAYIVTLKPSTASGTKTDIIQIGSQTDFSSSTNKTNPYKILWWRKM